MQLRVAGFVEAVSAHLSNTTGQLATLHGAAERLPVLYVQDAWSPHQPYPLTAQLAAPSSSESHGLFSQPQILWTGEVDALESYVVRLRKWHRACFYSPTVLPFVPPWIPDPGVLLPTSVTEWLQKFHTVSCLQRALLKSFSAIALTSAKLETLC